MEYLLVIAFAWELLRPKSPEEKQAEAEAKTRKEQSRLQKETTKRLEKELAAAKKAAATYVRDQENLFRSRHEIERLRGLTRDEREAAKACAKMTYLRNLESFYRR